MKLEIFRPTDSLQDAHGRRRQSFVTRIRSDKDSAMKLNGTSSLLFARRIGEPHLMIILLLFVAGFGLRYAGVKFALANSQDLVTDASRYMIIAQAILHLSYPYAREPVFPLVEAFSLLIFGSSIGVFRMTTAVLGSLVIPATYKLGEIVRSKRVGLIAAGLVALDPFLVWNSTRGLREELFSLILILLVYYAISASRDRFKTKAGVIEALLAASLILTRLESAAITIGICGFVVWYASLKGWKRPIAYVLAILSSTVGAVAGWMLFSWRQFGDPTATTNALASGWYLYEFGVTREVTMLEYLFKVHTPQQFVFMWILGIARIFNNLLSFYLGIVGLSLAIVGFLYLHKSPGTVLIDAVLVSYIGRPAVI